MLKRATKSSSPSLACWAGQCRLGDCRGFTLIELMVVVTIIAILAAIAFPSYAVYSRRAAESQAQQEMQKIAEQLERHKAKNFSYKGFDPNYIYGETAAMPIVKVPIGSTGTATKYQITIRDLNDPSKLLTDAAAAGRGWTIKAEVNNDPQNYNLLMTSAGLRCKNKATVTYVSCNSSEGW
ncbi:type IV pilin protein [Acinetobacter radioresistens]|jgi:type IV pilus assembly protein PilE|uniref:type IV pilin protein n=2 Tax=Moraxellaceae TaxID=468 RepID=UPI00292A5B7F|nr:prepilin-type N-terminal cleavage/methylation domain-containing protein [Acinetobacter radioresistens]